MQYVYSKEHLRIPITGLPSPVYILKDIRPDYFECAGGVPETTLIDWAASLLQPDKVFIDAGAHVGTWSISFTHGNRCRHAHAFEPQRKTFNALCGSIALSNLDEKITPYNVALGSKEGSIDLRLVSPDGGRSSTLALPYNSSVLTEKVKVRTLDSFELSNVGLIKIDVEGAELDVLKGALGTLEGNDWPLVLFEAWNEDWYAQQKKDLFTYVKSLGYTIIPINGWPEMSLAEHKQS